MEEPFEIQYHNRFSDSKQLKLNALQKENKKLKTNINALQEMLIIHEHSLEKCIDNNQKLDFTEWHNVFVQHLIEHESFLKKELATKESLNKEIKTLSKGINIQLTQCQNQFNHKLDGTNTKIHQIKNQLNQYIITTKSEKQKLYQKIRDLQSKLKNEVNLRQFYAEQIVCLTKQNQQFTTEIKSQNQHFTTEIKSQHQIIQNYQLKVNHLINIFYKLKQAINTMKNEQNNVNIAIKITLKTYLYQIETLKSNIHLKSNQIICCKSFEMLQTKKWMKLQFDRVSNFHFEQYHSINQQIVNLNSKINDLMNKLDHFKEESQAQKLIEINTRPKPRELESPSSNQKYNNNHILKLENLVKLTKALLDENEDEQLVKQLFKKEIPE